MSFFSHTVWTDKPGGEIQNIAGLCNPPPLFVIPQWHKDGIQILPGMFCMQEGRPTLYRFICQLLPVDTLQTVKPGDREGHL